MKEWVVLIDYRNGHRNRTLREVGRLKAESPRKAIENVLKRVVKSEEHFADIVGSDQQPVSEYFLVREAKGGSFYVEWDNEEDELKIENEGN